MTQMCCYTGAATIASTEAACPDGWDSPAHTALAGDRRDCEWRRMSTHLVSAICRSTRDSDGLLPVGRSAYGKLGASLRFRRLEIWIGKSLWCQGRRDPAKLPSPQSWLLPYKCPASARISSRKASGTPSIHRKGTGNGRVNLVERRWKSCGHWRRSVLAYSSKPTSDHIATMKEESWRASPSRVES